MIGRAIRWSMRFGFGIGFVGGFATSAALVFGVFLIIAFSRPVEHEPEWPDSIGLPGNATTENTGQIIDMPTPPGD